MKEEVMINWNKSKAGRWTTGGDPPRLYTTCLKHQRSRRTRDIWMVQHRSDVHSQAPLPAGISTSHRRAAESSNAPSQSEGGTLPQ